MNNEELLRQVLEKYKISMPLNPAVRKHIMKSRRRVLINIFKHYNQYNIIIAAALVVYYPLRSIGITANLVQSAIITFTVSAVIILSFITGGYFTIKKLIFTSPFEKHIISEKKSENENKPQIKKEIQIDKFENKIIFQGFKSSSADKTIVNQVNAEILKELYRVRGQVNVLHTPAQTGGILIVSSLEKMDNTYIIAAKSVNMETGLILLIKEDTALAHDLTVKSINIIKDIISTIK